MTNRIRQFDLNALKREAGVGAQDEEQTVCQRDE